MSSRSESSPLAHEKSSSLVLAVLAALSIPRRLGMSPGTGLLRFATSCPVELAAQGLHQRPACAFAGSSMNGSATCLAITWVPLTVRASDTIRADVGDMTSMWHNLE